MSLIAVRRLYPDAVPPTAWTLDGTPLTTKRFRFTRRTDQASSASFECSGSPALTIGDRVFAYGLTDIAGALGAAIADDSVTTMTLAAAGEIPAENYLVLIGTELIWCGLRTGTAVSACVRGIGGTAAAAHDNASPITVYWTWGGIVYTRTRTKKGYAYGCLDFIDALEGIPITATYPGAGTDDTDTEILTNVLTLQESPLGLQLDSTGVTPTGFRELIFVAKKAKSILEQFCTYTGNHYHCYQAWYDINPKLRYFDPSGAASGITLAAGDIYADWSVDESRSSLANKVIITANFDDVPLGDGWCKDVDTADLFGYHTSTPVTDLPVGKAAYNNVGFRFTNGKFTSKIKNICVRVKKVGTPASHLYFNMSINAGVSYSSHLIPHDDVTGSYTWCTIAEAANPTIPPFADVYVEFASYDGSDANYYLVEGAFGFADERLTPLKNVGITTDIWDAGATTPNAPPDFSFQIGTVALAHWTIVDDVENKVGYNSGENALYLTSAAPDLDHYIKVPISPSISHAEYDYLKFSVKGSASLFIVTLGKEAAMNNIYQWVGGGSYISVTSEWKEIVLQIGPTAPVYPNGWNAVVAPDWHILAELGFVHYQGTMMIKGLYFEGSAYSVTVENANSQAAYEIKVYTETVPFRTKAETDAYAATQLARLKDPLTSVSVRANRLLIPTMYNTVAVSPGAAMTPLVLGADIDPVRGQTRFVFDAYPQGGLVAILSSLNAGIS